MKRTANLHFNPNEKYFVEHRMWQGVPGLEVTGNRIWAAWFSGGKYEPCINNYGVVAYSDDIGKTWTEPYFVVSAEEGTNMRVMDVQLWKESSGRLWCYWAQDTYTADIPASDYDTTQGDDLFDKFFNDVHAWGIYTDNPEADRPTWSEVVYIGQGFIRNKPTELSNGNVLIPGYAVKSPTHVQYMLAKAFGKDVAICQGPQRIGAKGFDEPMAVERKDGSIWLLTRTNAGYICESSSHDGGKTWTETQKTALPNPCTRFFIGRLSNGMLLLINTPSSKLGNRKSLVAYLSSDDGKTWEHSLVLDERQGTTYPDVAEGSDGYIYVIYDCQRDNRQCRRENDPYHSDAEKEICLARITIEDILKGKIVTDGSFTSKIISKVTDFDTVQHGNVEGRF